MTGSLFHGFSHNPHISGQYLSPIYTRQTTMGPFCHHLINPRHNPLLGICVASGSTKPKIWSEKASKQKSKTLKKYPRYLWEKLTHPYATQGFAYAHGSYDPPKTNQDMRGFGPCSSELASANHPHPVATLCWSFRIGKMAIFCSFAHQKKAQPSETRVVLGMFY